MNAFDAVGDALARQAAALPPGKQRSLRDVSFSLVEIPLRNSPSVSSSQHRGLENIEGFTCYVITVLQTVACAPSVLLALTNAHRLPCARPRCVTCLVLYLAIDVLTPGPRGPLAADLVRTAVWPTLVANLRRRKFGRDLGLPVSGAPPPRLWYI